MGLKQFSQPIFFLPEYFTNFRAQQPPEVSIVCKCYILLFKSITLSRGSEAAVCF